MFLLKSIDFWPLVLRILSIENSINDDIHQKSKIVLQRVIYLINQTSRDLCNATLFCVDKISYYFFEIELPIEPIGRVGSVGGSGSECKVEGAFCNEDSDCCDKNCKPGNFQGVCRAR